MIRKQVHDAALKFGYLLRVIRQQSFAKLAVTRIAQLIAHADNIAEIVKLVNHPLTIFYRHILHNGHHVTIRVRMAIANIKVFTCRIYNLHTRNAMRHCIRISKFQISPIGAVSNAHNIIVQTIFASHLRPRDIRSFTISINNSIELSIIVVFKRHRRAFTRRKNPSQHIARIGKLGHASCAIRNTLKPPIAILESIRVAATVCNAQQPARIVQCILRALKAHNRAALILNFGVCAIIRQLKAQAGKVFVIRSTAVGFLEILLISVSF